MISFVTSLLFGVAVSEVIEKSKGEWRSYIDEHELVVVSAMMQTCGACRKWKPTFDAISQNQCFQNVKFVSLNDMSDKEAFDYLNATSFPTVAIIENGEVEKVNRRSSLTEQLHERTKKLGISTCEDEDTLHIETD